MVAAQMFFFYMVFCIPLTHNQNVKRATLAPARKKACSFRAVAVVVVVCLLTNLLPWNPFGSKLLREGEQQQQQDLVEFLAPVRLARSTTFPSSQTRRTSTHIQGVRPSAGTHAHLRTKQWSHLREVFLLRELTKKMEATKHQVKIWRAGFL